jgi:hypothetical protein
MAYKGLPPVAVTAAADTTGENTGNWTAVINSLPQVSYLTQFELYKIVVDGPVGYGLAVYVDNKKWSHTSQGWMNEWDPEQPLQVTSGQTLYFFFQAPTTATPVPTVTCWFRHDAGAGSYQ